MIFFENLHRFKKVILRKREFDIPDKVNFGSKKANFFYNKILKKSKFYFEYGSGSSTLQADKLKKKFVSIELDKTFMNLMNKKLHKKSVKFVGCGPVGEFSYPLIKNKKKILYYVKSINKYFRKNNHPDFILIDGRFRVACCINLFLLIKKNKAKATILLDDYEKRESYKILNKLFRVKKVGRMALLEKKKKNFSNITIDKYIFDSR